MKIFEADKLHQPMMAPAMIIPSNPLKYTWKNSWMMTKHRFTDRKTLCSIDASDYKVSFHFDSISNHINVHMIFLSAARYVHEADSIKHNLKICRLHYNHKPTLESLKKAEYIKLTKEKGFGICIMAITCLSGTFLAFCLCWLMATCSTVATNVGQSKKWLKTNASDFWLVAARFTTKLGAGFLLHTHQHNTNENIAK